MAKKIYINPGHSNNDPGAVGYETERVLTVKVSNFMNEYLQKNYDCETKVSPGNTDSLYAIADEANKWGADLFVSNHFNAAGGDGFEAFIYSTKDLELGKLFASHVKAAGQNLRSSSVAPGVKIRTNLAVLYRTKMPAILNEGAFVDNLKDIQDWNEDAELKTLGTAYAKAAAEYLKLEKKNTTPSAKPENKKDDPEPTVQSLSIKKGDTVSIAKNATYYSGKDIPDWVVSKNWIVSEDPVGDRVVVNKSVDGKHAINSPIHAKFLTVVEANEPWTPQVGDIVNYTGSKHYANANAVNGSSCKGGKARITNIYQLGKSKHPYHLVRVSGKGATVYGWVDEGSFTKA